MKKVLVVLVVMAGILGLTGCEKVNGKYTNFDGCVVLSENRKISNIYIVRTQIYFHDYRNPKYIENKNYNYFGDFQTHPKVKLDKDIQVQSTFLVDVGLLINIENDFLW